MALGQLTAACPCLPEFMEVMEPGSSQEWMVRRWKAMGTSEARDVQVGQEKNLVHHKANQVLEQAAQSTCASSCLGASKAQLGKALSNLG